MSKVFLGWSGARSNAVAQALRSWLPDAVEGVQVFLSSVDIDAGSRWGDRLAEELQGTNIGVICLTPENTNSPWLQFEAGALSRTVGRSCVIPYLFDMSATELTGPLAQFQTSLATPEGTFGVVKMINQSRNSEPIELQKIERQFKRCWPELQQMLKSVPPRPPLESSEKPSEMDVLGEILETVRQQSNNWRRVSDLFYVTDSGVEVISDKPLSIKAPIIKLN